MGWDALSTAPIAKSKKLQLKYKKHREAFAEAVKTVKENADMVDGGLFYGTLDCSDCKYMLRKAAEFSKEDLNWGLAWEEGMTPEVVKVMHMFLNWDFKYKKEDAWAYWSAKEFVRVCAEQGLGIRFSY